MDTGTKALATEAIDHRNNVIFAKHFQSEAEIAMRRLGLWYEAYQLLEDGTEIDIVCSKAINLLMGWWGGQTSHVGWPIG